MSEQGIVYFVSHRALWKPLLSRLAPTLTLSVGVLTAMFVLTYVPQFAVLVFVNGPLAVFTTVLLILNESSTLINIISRTWILQDALLDTFDGTLLARGSSDIVKEGRQLKAGDDPIQKLGKILKSPFERFSPKALIRYVMYLPLNAIPGRSLLTRMLHQESLLTVSSGRNCSLHSTPGPNPWPFRSRAILPAQELVRLAAECLAAGTLRALFWVNNLPGPSLPAARPRANSGRQVRCCGHAARADPLRVHLLRLHQHR